MQTFELLPKFDGRKSFYGKARVEEDRNVYTLYSYNSKILKLHRDTNKLERVYTACFSATTLRHVKEFLRQNGYNVKTVSDVLDLFDKQ